MSDPTSGPGEPPRWTRRGFLKLAGASAVVALTGGVVDATLVEPHWIRTTRTEIPLDRLPAAWDGTRIALLADFHHGSLVPLDYLREAIELSNRLRPDLVALAGDFVSSPDAITRGLSDALGSLAAPLGRFAVLGNHDYWTDPVGVQEMLRTAGIRVLTNRHGFLDRGGRPLCLAGVDDLWCGTPSLEAALAGAEETACRVLLCHNPDFAEEMPPRPRVDLMLCGHTHGGQVKVPFGPRPRLPIRYPRYAQGLVQGPRCKVYVSAGLGLISPPVRFNCRPELALLTLRTGA